MVLEPLTPAGSRCLSRAFRATQDRLKSRIWQPRANGTCTCCGGPEEVGPTHRADKARCFLFFFLFFFFFFFFSSFFLEPTGERVRAGKAREWIALVYVYSGCRTVFLDGPRLSLFFFFFFFAFLAGCNVMHAIHPASQPAIQPANHRAVTRLSVCASHRT